MASVVKLTEFDNARGIDRGLPILSGFHCYPSAALAALLLAGLPVVVCPATAAGPCGSPAIPIHAVQGSGSKSPEVGNTVEIEAVVVGDFGAAPGLRGYFLQEEDADADENPLSSEGLFVHAPGDDEFDIGDLVRVAGEVGERYGRTGLYELRDHRVCAAGQSVTPARVSLPVTSIGDFEAFEGMLVEIPQTLYIIGHFNFDRFNEILLSSGRQSQPTAIFEPGSPGRAQLAEANRLDRIILDDGRFVRYADPAIHPNGAAFGPANRFRGGDRLQGVTGILDYAFDDYRIHPTREVKYAAANPRSEKPPAVGGSLTVASFNTANYFTSLDVGAAICGPDSSLGCRGAKTARELARQRDKLVSAIAAMDADIVALIEIENHPADDALLDLLGGLNAVSGAAAYAPVDTGTIGADAIKTALIYRSASVSPVGGYAILDESANPAFRDDKNRPALAQTFEQKTNGERFTVVVNHLKSKRFDCNDVDDPDLGDGQGDCNLTRKAALRAEVSWLESDPTRSGDADFLIIGDFNAYAREDPVKTLSAAGYIDLIERYAGSFAYTYAYDGQLGYLDHAFASAGLQDQVTGAAVWHINVDEPDLIGYRSSPRKRAPYRADAYRSSDHDPILVGIELRDRR